LAVLNHRAVKFEMHRIGGQFRAVKIHTGQVPPVRGRGNASGHVGER
jgi:hypothetical protein